MRQFRCFCESNELHAYCNVGSHAVAKGGRPATTKLKVCLDRCNAFMMSVEETYDRMDAAEQLL
jgi:hypothetical protein